MSLGRIESDKVCHIVLPDEDDDVEVESNKTPNEVLKALEEGDEKDLTSKNAAAVFRLMEQRDMEVFHTLPRSPKKHCRYYSLLFDYLNEDPKSRLKLAVFTINSLTAKSRRVNKEYGLDEMHYGDYYVQLLKFLTLYDYKEEKLRTAFRERYEKDDDTLGSSLIKTLYNLRFDKIIGSDQERRKLKEQKLDRLAWLLQSEKMNKEIRKQLNDSTYPSETPIGGVNFHRTFELLVMLNEIREMLALENIDNSKYPNIVSLGMDGFIKAINTILSKGLLESSSFVDKLKKYYRSDVFLSLLRLVKSVPKLSSGDIKDEMVCWMHGKFSNIASYDQWLATLASKSYCLYQKYQNANEKERGKILSCLTATDLEELFSYKDMSVAMIKEIYQSIDSGKKDEIQNPLVRFRLFNAYTIEERRHFIEKSTADSLSEKLSCDSCQLEDFERILELCRLETKNAIWAYHTHDARAYCMGGAGKVSNFLRNLFKTKNESIIESFSDCIYRNGDVNEKEGFHYFLRILARGEIHSSVFLHKKSNRFLDELIGKKINEDQLKLLISFFKEAATKDYGRAHRYVEEIVLWTSIASDRVLDYIQKGENAREALDSIFRCLCGKIRHFDREEYLQYHYSIQQEFIAKVSNQGIKQEYTRKLNEIVEKARKNIAIDMYMERDAPIEDDGDSRFGMEAEMPSMVTRFWNMPYGSPLMPGVGLDSPYFTSATEDLSGLGVADRDSSSTGMGLDEGVDSIDNQLTALSWGGRYPRSQMLNLSAN